MQKYDPRNDKIQVWVGDGLVPRAEAKVSVFDSVVQGGDAVWEGLRIYAGRLFALDAHLNRLFASAKAMAFVDLPSRESVREALFATLRANGMLDEAHVRLTLTRGEKITSGMDPRLNRSGPCLIVLAEHKPPIYAAAGIRLITSAIRRNSPQCVDSKIHHNNLINNILAKIEANLAGVDDALMLDLDGFLSETNATNIFLVHHGKLLTPHPHSCLPGVTRALVIEIARQQEIPVEERNLSISEIWSADEAFTTGTMGELSPVLEVDGRTLGTHQPGQPGALTRRLQELYAQRTASEGTPIPEG